MAQRLLTFLRLHRTSFVFAILAIACLVMTGNRALDQRGAQPKIVSAADWVATGASITPATTSSNEVTTTATTDASYLVHTFSGLPAGNYRYTVELRAPGPVDLSVYLWTIDGGRVDMQRRDVAANTEWSVHSLDIVVSATSQVGVQVGGDQSFSTGESVSVRGAKLAKTYRGLPLQALIASFLVFGALSFPAIRRVAATAAGPVASRRWATLMLGLIIGAHLLVVSTEKPFQPIFDAAQNFSAAYNVAKFGVFSTRFEDDPAKLRSDSEREPFYPLALSVILKTTADIDEHPLSCYLKPEPQCQKHHYSYFGLNVGLAILIIISTWFATAILTRSHAAAAVAASYVALSPTTVLDLPHALTELPAALFLLLHSIFLYQAFRDRPSYLFSVLAGLALALLIWVKFVFFAWLLLVAPVTLFLTWRNGPVARRRSAIALLALLGATTPILLAKDPEEYARVFFGPPAERSKVLALIDMEYEQATWKEYAAGWVYFTPYVGPPLTLKHFGQEAYNKYDLDRPDSFFGMAAGRYANRATISPDTRPHSGLKRVAFIPLFAYRGAFIGSCCSSLYNTLLPYQTGESLTLNAVLKAIHPFFVITALFLVFHFLLFNCVALFRRDFSVLLFTMPSLFSFAIYAVATDFIPRYSQPLLPVVVIVTVMAASGLFQRLKRHTIPS